jgi:hypothetical protein
VSVHEKNNIFWFLENFIIRYDKEYYFMYVKLRYNFKRDSSRRRRLAGRNVCGYVKSRDRL